MIRNSLRILALAVTAALLVPAAWAQSASVKGKVTDEQGQPIVGAIVVYHSQDTGRKHELKTDKSGNYYSIGVQGGIYKVSLYANEEDYKANKTLYFFNNVQVLLSRPDSMNPLDFDMAKERAKAGGEAAPQLTEEQKKAREKTQKENEKIRNLNQFLSATRTAMDAGRWDEAIALMTEASTIDPSKDLLWFNLGEAYLGAKQYEEAIEAYNKAIAIRASGAYYNNLGQALIKAGRAEEAVTAYTTAATIDVANAGQYYYNLGAVMVNAGRMDESIAAFDKAIAADPTRADAYYWKGIALIGKATVKDNKMIAPPGTDVAFNKYLELEPSGTYAEAAKQMLASIGSEVETSFKKPKSKK